jgi:hypothetical protein
MEEAPENGKESSHSANGTECHKLQENYKDHCSHIHSFKKEASLYKC